MKTLRTSAAGRFLMVAVMLLSWLVLTNHCALALLTAHAPGHAASCCHQPGTPPLGDGPCHDATPCCKVVKASLTASDALKLHLSPPLVPMLAVLQWLAAPAVVADCEVVVEHGPPRLLSFAEAVLQRSLLSHAPPAAA